MLWNPKRTDVGRVWGLRLSGNELVFLISLRFDALVQVHTAPGAQYRDRYIRTDRWMVGGDRLGVDGVFARRHVRRWIEYRMPIDRLTTATVGHAVVTLGHCFRVLDILGDETLSMEGDDPQHWWVENMQLAGMASTLHISVTPSAARHIACMDEQPFRLVAPLMAGICRQMQPGYGLGLTRAERGSKRTPYLMIDSECACFGAGGEVFRPGCGYEMASHNFRSGTHLLTALTALAHFSTVMDNTRIN